MVFLCLVNHLFFEENYYNFFSKRSGNMMTMSYLLKINFKFNIVRVLKRIFQMDVYGVDHFHFKVINSSLEANILEYSQLYSDLMPKNAFLLSKCSKEGQMQTIEANMQAMCILRFFIERQRAVDQSRINWLIDIVIKTLCMTGPIESLGLLQLTLAGSGMLLLNSFRISSTVRRESTLMVSLLTFTISH